MHAVISPALFRIHPSENIYWTNYNGLPLNFSSCVTHALAAFPVLCQDVSLLMAVVLTAMQEKARGWGGTMAARRVDYVSFSSASPHTFSSVLFLSVFRCQKPSINSHLYFPTGMQMKPKTLKVTLKTFLCQIIFFFFLIIHLQSL